MNDRWRVWGISLFACVLAASSTVGAQFTRTDWLRADTATTRLNPSAFPSLPSQVRTALERRGCTIPQPSNADHPQNVISGEFTDSKQTDWAVLCSRERRSAILVFRGWRSDQVDELAEEADLQYLQVTTGNREIGYSRRLAVATPKTIRQRIPVRGAAKPRVTDHDGIENTFVGKASVVWYCLGGKWIRLSGSD